MSRFEQGYIPRLEIPFFPVIGLNSQGP
jgi:hypothetical protein